MDARIIETAEERAKVYRLRYEVLVEDLGWTIEGADPETRTCTDPLDESSLHFGAFVGEALIACMRVNWCGRADLSEIEDLYGLDRADPAYPDRVVIISKLMVDKAHRRSMAVPRLLLLSFAHGLRTGAARIYLDCSPDLVPFYEKVGFLPVGADVETETYGTIVPMRLDMEDIAHLNRVRGPLSRVLAHHEAGHIEAYLESCRTSGLEDFADWGGGPLFETNPHVFDGLDDARLAKVFRADSIREFADGEVIFAEGAPSWEFGVILRGRAVVRQTIGGEEKLVALYSRGQVVGEMGFLRGVPRSAEVTALGETRLAMFPAAVVSHLLETDPDIAVVLYRNLAVILAERLAHAHDWPEELA